MSQNVFGLRTPKNKSRQVSRSDPEKYPLAEDDWEDADSDYTPVSSRATSYNYSRTLHTPMLATSKAPPKSTWLRMNRRKFNKYFALILGSGIIIFIVLLVNASINSRWDLANSPLRSNKPAVYESFPFLKRYYGGVRNLASRKDNVPEYPGDREEILEMLRNISSQKEHAEKREPNDFLLARPFNPPMSTSVKVEECYLDETTRVPKLHVFDGVVDGFPDPIMGSYELFGLDNGVCFDRYGKLGPYGLGYSQNYGGSGAGTDGDTEGSEMVWKEIQEVDFRKVRWADAQSRCIEKNKKRFDGAGSVKGVSNAGLPKRQDENSLTAGSPSALSLSNTRSASTTTPRHLVLIRTWHEYEYDTEDIIYLRSLIAELGLASGGEYEVHFLIHVKDHGLPIWVDPDVYQQVLDQSLPAEFRGMGTLWSEAQMTMLYGGLSESNYRGLPVHGVYRSTYLPVQWFAHTHPEYDFFWHWEMDIRYTGHYYHLFDRIGAWTKQQPRKGLWERNGRFYIPSEHGSFDDFRHMVRIQTEQASKGQTQKHFDAKGRSREGPPSSTIHLEKPVWGPQSPDLEWNDIDLSDAPEPPTSYEKDDYEWGVGEDADFITFNPLFDPDTTGWILDKDVTGYNITAGLPPRRTAIITASRLSRRLLDTMHRETAHKKHIMFSEMWPGSCALHHGLKAVYAPHPVYIDRRWPTDYLAAVFNGGKNGASGGSKLSTFEDARQRNFLGTTWYYHAKFSERLWKRWLGHMVEDDSGETSVGGSEFELEGEGRMCLPAMLLHPVKQVDLVHELKDAELDATRDDMETGNAGG